MQAATGTVPGAQYASISSVGRRREVRTLAATGELARAVDQAQYETGEGPCPDALYEHRTVRLPDLDGTAVADVRRPVRMVSPDADPSQG